MKNKNQSKWEERKLQIMKRDSFTCQACGCKELLVVHRFNIIKGMNMWEYDEGNLITLCSECHKKIHNIK